MVIQGEKDGLIGASLALWNFYKSATNVDTMTLAATILRYNMGTVCDHAKMIEIPGSTPTRNC